MFYFNIINNTIIIVTLFFFLQNAGNMNVKFLFLFINIMLKILLFSYIITSMFFYCCWLLNSNFSFIIFFNFISKFIFFNFFYYFLFISLFSILYTFHFHLLFYLTIFFLFFFLISNSKNWYQSLFICWYFFQINITISFCF